MFLAEVDKIVAAQTESGVVSFTHRTAIGQVVCGLENAPIQLTIAVERGLFNGPGMQSAATVVYFDHQVPFNELVLLRGQAFELSRLLAVGVGMVEIGSAQ
jgi:hypothetical protein